MNIQQELERIFAGRSLPADIDPLPDGWPPRARSPRRAFSWQSPKYCMTVKEALDIFCKLINGEKPILVPLEPRPWAKLKKCFDNTDEMVARHGGRKCLGWLFQHRPFGNGPGVFLGVHHAVWEHDGRLLDVTPPCEDTMLNGNAIWFLPDRSATQLRPAGSTIEIPPRTGSIRRQRIPVYRNSFRLFGSRKWPTTQSEWHSPGSPVPLGEH